ncbi:hypothetical protein U1701_03095 [Sphingomonas sp. PB2P19]|uniref:hypothetical protein n=1 Tax=Sphingomonas rhamnosi TaxID=3096156 RepID=UPI002FC723C5
MKLGVSLLILCLPGVATAQAFRPSEPAYPFVDLARQSDGHYNLVRSNDTPTMRAQKLRRAIALRDEAAALVAQDGGTLTDRHRAYLRREASNILDGSR